MPFAELYKNIFEKDGPNEHSTELLQELVKEYPYFSLAHFYLLQQTPESAEQYPQVAAKTALHFNNPYFLQAQLRASRTKTGIIEIVDEEAADSPALVPEVNEDAIEAGENEATINTDILAPEDLDPMAAPLESEMGKLQEADENSSGVESSNSGMTQQADASPELREHDSVNEDHLPEEEPNVDDETPGTGEEIHYVPINLPQDSLPEVKETIAEAEAQPEVKEVHTNIEGEAIVEKGNDAEIPAHGILSRPAQQQKETSMLFEPLHATDYFASQGIKLKEEAQPADKLGKQLKSFTEWLKTMKKVHEPGADINPGNIDLSVQTLAEKSNKEEDIITEAMAEVFMQQGKGNKAREIYKKLSLLNPAKSAYFAAKIDQIK
jgi:hypothetical protein